MSIFDEFNRIDATYKTIDSHNIDLTILTPKDISPGKHPVILRFHGGYLICGSRMQENWFANWITDLAIQHQAILISADYRLMPEATGLDILSDISSLLTWLPINLSSHLSPLNVHADLHSILAIGESAGGYLAVQSALLHASSPHHRITACISQFGMLDLETSFYMTAFERTILGNPMQDRAIVDRHLHALKKGDIPKHVSSPRFPKRLDLTLAIVQHGLYTRFLGAPEDAPSCYPMRNLDGVERNGVPPVWLFHGTEDSAVPVEGTRAFVKKLKALHPQTPVRMTILECEEHSLDGEMGLGDEKAGFVREGVNWITPYWLGKEKGRL